MRILREGIQYVASFSSLYLNTKSLQLFTKGMTRNPSTMVGTKYKGVIASYRETKLTEIEMEFVKILFTP